MNGQILRSLKETILFEHPTYIGGGTDIMPLLKNGVRDDCELVFLKKIPELRELTDAESYLVIGSGMTLTELAENKLVNERCTAVAQAASLTASPQIRNIATIGGNIMQDRRCIYFNQTHLAQRPCLLLQDRRHYLPPNPQFAGVSRNLLFRCCYSADCLRCGG